MSKTRRLIIFIISSAFTVAAIILWILNKTNILSGDWSDIMSIIFIGAAVLLPLIQWLFPLTPTIEDKPLSSNVKLIDAAIDSNDSPYKQVEENNVTKVVYMGKKPKRVKKSN